MKVDSEVINRLRAAYPWPAQRPDTEPAEWLLDGGGKQLVTDQINDGARLVVEVGVFLGSTLKIWLAAKPDVHVVAIDPWAGEWWARYARKHGRVDVLDSWQKPDGPYETFLSSLWEHRDRVHPVRGSSPEKLYELADLGIEPDLFYFDNDKTGGDVSVAHELFPSATLSGDDWNWGIAEGYPIREPVKRFAAKHQFTLHLNRATWLLDRKAKSPTDYFNGTISCLKDMARAAKSFSKPSHSEVIR